VAIIWATAGLELETTEEANLLVPNSYHWATNFLTNFLVVRIWTRKHIICFIYIFLKRTNDILSTLKNLKIYIRNVNHMDLELKPISTGPCFYWARHANSISLTRLPFTVIFFLFLFYRFWLKCTVNKTLKIIFNLLENFIMVLK
jgi:hypothetical protein